jgi:prepilin-type N-terminal cleavage/methylation domain-containing protein
MKILSEKGFTLVELVVIIVIAGILLAVAVPKFLDLSNGAKAAACKQNQAAIETAAAVGFADHAIDPAVDADYPTQAELVSEGYLDEFPACPGNGTITYNDTNGTSTCVGEPTHLR